MVNIDYILLRTQNTIIINRVFKRMLHVFTKKAGEKGWTKSYEIYTNNYGVTLYFRRNRFGDFDKMFVGFSAHAQINGGLHNADFRTFAQAQRSIINVFAMLAVRRGELGEFGVSNIEIGTNFRVYRDPYKILDAALMFDKHFYQYHDKYCHYKFSTHPKKTYKYLKAKFYIKSFQIDSATGLTYQDLAFCDQNIMRLEFKLERASKFKFMNFSSLESLFKKDAEKQLEKFFMEQFAKMFFYSPTDIITRGLKKFQLKHFYQWQVPTFWAGLDARKLKSEKNLYNLLPKKYDVRKEVEQLLTDEIECRNSAKDPTFIDGKKMSIFLPYEVVSFRTPFLSHNILRVKKCKTYKYLGIGKQTITNI